MASEKDHSVKVIIVNKINDLDIYEEGWNTLLENCEEACPSQSYIWIKSFFRYILNDSKKWICLFALNSKEEIVGIYPLICQDKKVLLGFYYQNFQTPYHGLNTTRADGLILENYEYVLELFIEKIKETFNVFPIIHAIDIPGFSSSIRSSEKSNKRISFFPARNVRKIILI